jgi:hypothetical protein
MMKAKSKPRLSVADAVYEAIHDLEDATDKQLIAHVSKLCGKKVTPAQFKRAIKALPNRL